MDGAAVDPIVEEVKEHFALKALLEKVYRLEGENKELKQTNALIDTQYVSKLEHNVELLKALQDCADENHAKIALLEGENKELQQLREDERLAAKNLLDEERAQWENKVHEMQMRNDNLESELRNLKDFREKKDKIEAENVSLKQKLTDQDENHSRDISAFDRKKAVEIDMLKKDMHRNVRETREMLKARTKDQLDATTKRIIMENEQMITELHFQSKETERLLEKHQQLVDENSQLRRNLLIHKDLEVELARRTHVYQKLVKKMSNQRSQLDSAGASGEQSSRDLPSGMVQSRELPGLGDGGPAVQSRELPGLGDGGGPSEAEDAEAKRQKQQELESTLQVVRHEFAQYRRDHATLTQLQDQSTRLVIAALYELKNQRECDPFPPASYDENATWQFTNMTGKQKEYFFRVLLEKLNSSMCGSCFPVSPGHASPGTQGASLPQLGHQHGSPGNNQQGSFSQFLWSIASHNAPGGSPPAGASVVERKHIESKGVQTETMPEDPCLKKGLWNPAGRPHLKDSPQVSTQMVSANVRAWGGKASSLPQTHSRLGSRRIV